MNDKVWESLIERAKKFNNVYDFIDDIGYETWMDDFTEAAEDEPMSESECDEIESYLRDAWKEAHTI